MSTSTLAAIQAQMNFYAYPILMVLGSIGNIFIFVYFIRQRANACSIYLMHSAITNLLYLISNGLFKIFPVAYYDDTLGLLISCKFSTYTPGYLGQVAKTILVLACIDRYLMTSQRARFRAFSTPRRAQYLVLLSYVIWLFAASHVAIWTTVSHGQCLRVGVYATVFTFYAILFVGLIPFATICLFGYLTYRNMGQLRKRIRPTGQDTNNFIQRRDRDLLILVIAEAVLYITTTSLLPAVVLETMISQYTMTNKPMQYFLSEIFALNVAYLLLYVYSAAPFYVYIISSASFRRDCQQFIVNSYRKVTHQVPNRTTLNTSQNVTQRDIRI